MIPGMALVVPEDEPGHFDEPKLRVGRCLFDPRRRILTDERGVEVSMTPLEFDLLKAFVENPNRPLSRDRLLDVSPRGEREPFDRCVDLRVMRLRRKIEPDPKRPRFIRTIRSEGYVFLPEAS
jgi:DNA-binding response OmpR family regulator